MHIQVHTCASRLTPKTISSTRDKLAIGNRFGRGLSTKITLPAKYGSARGEGGMGGHQKKKLLSQVLYVQRPVEIQQGPRHRQPHAARSQQGQPETFRAPERISRADKGFQDIQRLWWILGYDTRERRSEFDALGADANSDEVMEEHCRLSGTFRGLAVRFCISTQGKRLIPDLWKSRAAPNFPKCCASLSNLRIGDGPRTAPS
eukprot:5711081-Karenia_brevis.AAC.1